MCKDEQNSLPAGCRLIDIPEARDARGALTAVEVQRQVPFPIQRIFWIHEVPEGAERGGHAHRENWQFVVPVSGAFTMIVTDGCCRRSVRLNSPHRALLIPAGIWGELKDFAKGTVVLVAASLPYIPGGYINTFDEYLKFKGL